MQPPPPPEAAPDSDAEGLHNPGCPFDADEIQGLVLDQDEVASRCAALGSGARDDEAVELVRAIGCIDLTTLASDDTPERVRSLCERALVPVPPPTLTRLGIVGEVQVAGVCVYPRFVPVALDVLRGTRVRICTVAAGFPDGAGSLPERLAGIAAAREAGAQEIDVVIRRALAQQGAWRALHAEIAAFRSACGPVPMKVILGTGELGDATTIARAGATALMAGADFLKTSTGKEAVNATLPAGLVMARMIRRHADRTGFEAGIKPAGGLATPAQALAWLELARTALGPAWLTPRRLRFGASSLLDKLLERLAAL